MTRIASAARFAEASIARDWDHAPSTSSLGAPILDARIDWIDYRFLERLVKEDPQVLALKEEALRARAATGVIAESESTSGPPPPDPSRGHPPRRLQLGIARKGGEKPFALLSFRPALQDLLDPATGYPESSRLEFMNLRLRIDPRIRLEELALFRAQSLTPVTRAGFEPSWKAGLIFDRRSSGAGARPLGFRGEFSGGATVSPIPRSEALRLFALLGGRIDAFSSGEPGLLKPALAGELGVHMRWNDHVALLASWERFRFWNGTVAPGHQWGSWLNASVRFNLSERWGWGISLENRSGEGTWESGATYFF